MGTLETSPRRAAVFLDRDGTLIEDVGYLSEPGSIAFLDGAVDALQALRELGFALVLVSNQSGIARGLISVQQAEAVHRRFAADLEAEGIDLDAVRYCPHGPDAGCPCRKPLPGLIVDAAKELGIELDRSFVVGDKATDVEAGRRAGCRTIQLGRDDGDPDFSALDWPAAVDFIRHSVAAAA
jgi:D-glycero-D-manno-heptose 1,7-bisphosphate phosphatase